MENTGEHLTTLLARFTGHAAIFPPDDVREKLEAMRAEETEERARMFYDAMLRNLERAGEKHCPCCQDTGTLQYYVQVGSNFPYLADLPEILNEAAIRATKETPLRPNVVRVFDDTNTGTNVGEHIPWIDTEILPHENHLIVTLYLAGGGCSRPGMARAFPPLEGEEGLLRMVREQVATHGVNACPPLLVGVGIAGSMDVAAKLSKKALLRKIGSVNAHPEGARLEAKLQEELDALAIGPGGVGGRRSVLGVHVEEAGRHPAAYAVGLSVSCWIHRRAVIRIEEDLSYEVLSHKGAVL